MPIIIEEGTQNLLPNPNFEGTYVSGIAPNWFAYVTGSATGIRAESASALAGSKAQQITRTGGAASDIWGIRAYRNAIGSTTAAVSVYIKVLSFTPGAVVRLFVDFTRGPWGVGQSHAVVADDVGKWIRLQGSAAVDSTDAYTFFVWIDGANADILVDCAQVEAKPYATSFIDGTRSPEILPLPTAGVWVPGSWTKEFYFSPTSAQVVTGKTGYLWDLYIDANNYYALKVGPNGKPYLEIKSNGTIYQTTTASAPALAVDAPYAFAVRGTGSLMALFVNGSKISEVGYAEPVGTLPANQYLGCDHTDANHANGKFGVYRDSSCARTDAEILAAYQAA